jgi:hypothetical protein
LLVGQIIFVNVKFHKNGKNEKQNMNKSVMLSTLNVIKFLKNGMRNILLDILYNKNEWLLLQKIIQLLVFHSKNKLLSDEMMSYFYKTKMLSCIIIVPSHWNKSQQVDINPLGQTFSDSESIGLCSYSWILSA